MVKEPCRIGRMTAAVLLAVVFLTVNGRPVEDARQLRLECRNGKTRHHRLRLIRSGKSMEVPLTLGEFPSKPDQQAAVEEAPGGALQGLRMDELTPQIARELQLPPGTKGVVVSRVGETSAARHMYMVVGSQ